MPKLSPFQKAIRMSFIIEPSLLKLLHTPDLEALGPTSSLPETPVAMTSNTVCCFESTAPSKLWIHMKPKRRTIISSHSKVSAHDVHWIAEDFPCCTSCVVDIRTIDLEGFVSLASRVCIRTYYRLSRTPINEHRRLHYANGPPGGRS